MGKRAKHPTDEQAMLIYKNGLDPKDWLVLWESDAKICLAHKGSGTSRRIDK